MTHPERIRAWVEREFNPLHVGRVFADLLDVATGNRPGNGFERAALARIFPDSVFNESAKQGKVVRRGA